MSLVITNTNFWGDVVEELATLAVTQNEIVEAGAIYIQDGIIKNRALSRVRQSQIIQPRKATPTPQGDHTYDERVLNPDDFMVYVEFNPNDFSDLWQYLQPVGQFNWTKLKPAVQKELLTLLISGENGVDNYMGSAILNGDKTLAMSNPLSRFNGLIVKALADVDVIDVTNYAALTVSNILAKLDDTIDQTREPIRNSPNYKILMNSTDWETYGKALRALDFKGIDWSQGPPKTYRGKTLVPLAGMPANNMIATIATDNRGSNIHLGVRGFADFSSIQVEKLQANSELWFFKMLMAADTQIKFGQDMAFYHP